MRGKQDWRGDLRGMSARWSSLQSSTAWLMAGEWALRGASLSRSLRTSLSSPQGVDLMMYFCIFSWSSDMRQILINIMHSPLLFHILNARERLEPQEQQGAPADHGAHRGPEEAPPQHPGRQEPPRQSQPHQPQALPIRPPRPPPEEDPPAGQPRHGQPHHAHHAGQARPQPHPHRADLTRTQPQGLLLTQPQPEAEGHRGGELQDVLQTGEHLAHHPQGAVEEEQPPDLQVQGEPPPRQTPQPRLLPRSLQDPPPPAQVQVHQPRPLPHPAPPQAVQACLTLSFFIHYSFHISIIIFSLDGAEDNQHGDPATRPGEGADVGEAGADRGTVSVVQGVVPADGAAAEGAPVDAEGEEGGGERGAQPPRHRATLAQGVQAHKKPPQIQHQVQQNSQGQPQKSITTPPPPQGGRPQKQRTLRNWLQTIPHFQLQEKPLELQD